jgi:hypothetical protein
VLLAFAESPTHERSSSSFGYTDGGQASKWKLVRCENGTPCFFTMYG